jgi:hypothetical protein
MRVLQTQQQTEVDKRIEWVRALMSFSTGFEHRHADCHQQTGCRDQLITQDRSECSEGPKISLACWLLVLTVFNPSYGRHQAAEDTGCELSNEVGGRRPSDALQGRGQAG